VFPQLASFVPTPDTRAAFDYYKSLEKPFEQTNRASALTGKTGITSLPPAAGWRCADRPVPGIDRGECRDDSARRWNAVRQRGGFRRRNGERRHP
jgi:hypothetical protein